MSLATKIIVAVVVIVIAIIIGLVASSLRKLTSEEVGFQYDVHERKIKYTLYKAGLHFGPPGYRFIIFPKIYKTMSFPSVKCLDKDGLEIKLRVHFQYRPHTSEKDIKNIVKSYRDEDYYTLLVMDTALQVIYDVCSEYDVTEFQTLRVQFQSKLLMALDDRLHTDYTTRVRGVQIDNIERPSAFENVLRDKEIARQKIEVARLERQRVIAAAKTKTSLAQAEANITISKAERDANITLINANAHAQAVYKAYRTEAETYREVMLNLNLTVGGLISYLSTRTIQYSEKPIHINMDAPAITSYRNESFERSFT